jgi:AP2 domain-containing protein
MRTLPLTRGLVAFVDDGDFERLSKFHWQAVFIKGNWYAKRARWNGKNNDSVYLHSEVLQTSEPVDHRDGNGLNNRRKNLRSANKSKNGMAYRRKTPGKTSQYRGVSFHKPSGKWRAYICSESRMLHLGLFEFEQDAARAYDVAAKEHFKGFASPNFK